MSEDLQRGMAAVHLAEFNPDYTALQTTDTVSIAAPPATTGNRRVAGAIGDHRARPVTAAAT
jgi:hypothetical protein